MSEDVFEDKPVCFVCKSSCETVLAFKEDSFRKCKLSLHIRKVCNLKTYDAILSDETYQNYGYHSTCFRNFNAIKKTYKERYEREQADADTSEDAAKFVEIILPQLETVTVCPVPGIVSKDDGDIPMPGPSCSHTETSIDNSMSR